MSQSTTSRPTERNWADLMDDLLNENFTVQARSKLRAMRADPRPQIRPAPPMERSREAPAGLVPQK